MADRHTAETAPSRPANKHTRADLRGGWPDPTCVQLGPSRTGRDINDGPVHAPDGSFACGDPDCYGCWPEGHPNTVAYSAAAVCCPTEASARRHRDRATWWQHGELWRTDWGTPDYPRLWIGYDQPERRWTR